MSEVLRMFETWAWIIMCGLFVVGFWLAPSVTSRIASAHGDTAIIGCDRSVMEGIEGRLRRIEEGVVSLERRVSR